MFNARKEFQLRKVTKRRGKTYRKD